MPDPISSPRLQPVGQPDPQAGGTPFGNPTSDPNLRVAAPPSPQPPASNGITIPSWVLQVIPVIALLTGAIMVFAQQRADVEQLKGALIEIKAANDKYVSKQIFEMKMSEYDKYQVQMNQRFDKLEGLIGGLYDRLPAKREK